eukprot:15143-Heterococcus_DN1.PRE.1
MILPRLLLPVYAVLRLSLQQSIVKDPNGHTTMRIAHSVHVLLTPAIVLLQAKNCIDNSCSSAVLEADL